MIPRKIHYCWFGRGKKPPLAKKCIASWQKYCPDYELVEWNEDNFDVFRNGYTRMCMAEKKYAFLSDYARLVILEREGGIYFDTDVEVVRSFDSLLKYPAFMGFEDDAHVATGLGVGAEAGNPVIRAMLSEYDDLLDGRGGVRGCPILNTQALVKCGLVLNGRRQHLEAAEIFPAECFNPYDDPTGRLKKTKHTFSIHWYAKSWMNRRDIVRSTLTKPLHRVLGKDFFRKGNRSENAPVPRGKEASDRRAGADKKTILIFSHAMELGGAERALLGLLEAMDYGSYEVDLFLMRHEGELLKYLPEEVNLLPESLPYTCLAVPGREVFARKQYAVAAGRALGKAAARLRVKKLGLSKENAVGVEYSHKFTGFAMPRVGRREYDLAVSFLTPHYFVSQKVRARKKAAWIHTDYGKVDVDAKSELKMWEKYDHIVSISEDVTARFLKRFPSLENRMVLIPNMLPGKSIREQAGAFSALEEMPEGEEIRFLSIGRFCYAKNFDSLPDILRRIRERGHRVHWYIIGYGSGEEDIKRAVREAGMQDHVTILGKRENPYPYILACDYYLQLSRYEGYSVSVREAQLLGRPVIISAYPTAKSQLCDGEDGRIVPLENEACARAISGILSDPGLKEKLMKGCGQKDYTNRQEIGKLALLIK